MELPYGMRIVVIDKFGGGLDKVGLAPQGTCHTPDNVGGARLTYVGVSMDGGNFGHLAMEEFILQSP